MQMHKFLKEVAMDGLDKNEIEEECEAPKDSSPLWLLRLESAPEIINVTVEAAIKVHEKNRVQNFFDSTAEEMVPNFLKQAHG